MMCAARLSLVCSFVGLSLLLLVPPRLAQPGVERIGLSDGNFLLGTDNIDARAVAYAEVPDDGARLFVLDHKQVIYAYRVPPAEQAAGSLKLVNTYSLDGVEGLKDLNDPRGLAVEMKQGAPVFYFLDWLPRGNRQSLLIRFDVATHAAKSIDLTRHVFRIGDREPADVALCGGNRLLVCFDASGYDNPDVRVQRGLVEIQWRDGLNYNPQQVRHLPDAGTESSEALTWMDLEDAHYVWATVGEDLIYCADAATGRGLFYFGRPAPGTGLAYGGGWLWAAAGVKGPDRIYRINVTRNPDAYYEGPHVLRRLVMRIKTTPADKTADAGAVYHNYSRPAGYELLHRQGVWPETELLVDESHAANASLETTTMDPAGDVASRQILRSVVYADAPSRAYASRYEIDMWTSPYRKFVYPHRVNRDMQDLTGTDYLSDDPELYNLSDQTTYAQFIQRVRTHIQSKYGVAADMDNPYWAARNVVEYIQDNYYYPNREKRRPATVDYDRHHYDANPANLKIELSDREYDQTQIIACSGTSVMVTGAMRFLKIPARWLGTGTPVDATDWDKNGNTLLDGDERADCTNGHRYTQVWLGSHYGWICFDATPSKPAWNDYDAPPPLQSQWRFMVRAAGGHRKENRIVFNVASELIPQLYRDYQYDNRLAIDNNCGGDQRYNLQGRFEKPKHWNLPSHKIQVMNPCAVQVQDVVGSRQQATVNWRLTGPWQRIPDATVSIVLQQIDGSSGRGRNVAVLAQQIPATDGKATVTIANQSGPFACWCAVTEIR